jgi:hypothetical protein
VPSDSAKTAPYGETDTSFIGPQPLTSDTSFVTPDTTQYNIFPTLVRPDSLVAESLQVAEIKPSVYHEHVYIGKGPADEVKGVPDVLVISPGPVGSPAIAVDYLNVTGTEITLNGLPFSYQGLYRPYVTGTDLNSLPWEILNEIRWNPKDRFSPGLDFREGRPIEDSNRSDVDVARGPYSYEAARWRFFRPLGKKIYAYFTVGFKKSGGYLINSDYSGFHVTGGASYKLPKGVISLDLWQHKANMSLNSFDFISSQESKQKRVIDRGELNYRADFKGRYLVKLTGLLQGNNQDVTGYNHELKENYIIGGGKALLSDSTAGRVLDASVHYYKLVLSKLGHFPVIGDLGPSVGLRGKLSPLSYDFKMAYDWNKIDKGILLPEAGLSFEINHGLFPFAEVLRSRQLPDLNLLYFVDNVTGLGNGQPLTSYAFIGDNNLSMPVTNQATLGLKWETGKIKTMAGASYKKIDSQITLSYSNDSQGNFVVRPVNFNDRYTEIFARGAGEGGPITLELSGAYRIWKDRYFSDNLEKGPVALGFARLSFLKQFFISRLYLGGSLETRFSTRRDYRSIVNGFTDAFASFSGRLEFRYKDLTIWLNDENLNNTAYSTWWPYLETPRIVWVGFLWDFFD